MQSIKIEGDENNRCVKLSYLTAKGGISVMDNKNTKNTTNPKNNEVDTREHGSAKGTKDNNAESCR